MAYAKHASERSGLPADWIWAQWAHESGHFKSYQSLNYNNYAGLTVPASMPGEWDGKYHWGIFPDGNAFADYWGGTYIPKYVGVSEAKTLSDYLTTIQSQPDGINYCSDPPGVEPYRTKVLNTLGNSGTDLTNFKGSGAGDNLEGYMGPSYNFVTDDDSSAVRTAKIIAQKKWMQTNVFRPDIQATKVTIFDDLSNKLNLGEQLEEVKKMTEEQKQNDYSDLWNQMVDILGEIANNTKGLDKSIQNIKMPSEMNRTIVLPTGATASPTMNIEMMANSGQPPSSKQAEANAKIAAGGDFKK